MQRVALIIVSLGAIILSPCRIARAEEKNLLDNPSFEVTIEKNQFGHVFKSWGGWKYEGDCDFKVVHVWGMSHLVALLDQLSQKRISKRQHPPAAQSV